MTAGIVVTGFGAITPLGVGADALHARAVAEETAIIDGVALCRDFDPSAVLNPREVRRYDRFAQLALGCAVEAVDHAQWRGALPYPADRICCIVATGLGGIGSLLAEARNWNGNADYSPSALFIPLLMVNAAAAAIAMRFGLHGESAALAAACAGSTQAIGAACRLIRSGEASAVLVGGAEAIGPQLVEAGFSSMGALSTSGTSVPFDSSRNGFVLGEGAGILVLEAAEAAAARNAPIRAQVIGYGATSDAFHLTKPAPDATSAAGAIAKAVATAGIAPVDLDLINAHGTGTALNDHIEALAIVAALGAAGSRTPVTSTKSSTGHLLGAAGAVEAIALIQALRHGVAPPTVGLVTPDPRLPRLDHVLSPRTLASTSGTLTGLTNSFGFGGHNASLILRVEAGSGIAA